MKLTKLFSAGLIFVVPATITAQTVTVNKAGGPGVYTTISDALASFNQPEDITLDDTVPNIVQITDAGVYEEVISIFTPVTLESTGAQKATIELLPNPSGFYEYAGASPLNQPSYPAGNRHGYGGIFVSLPSSMTTGTVKIKNLNILPSLNSTLETRLRSVIENGNNNLYLELNNVLVAPNLNHQPAIDNGTTTAIPLVFPGSYVNNSNPPIYNYPATYNPNIVQFGAHGIVLGRTYYPAAVEGAGVELLVKDSIITTIRNDYYIGYTEPERLPTCIVMHTAWSGNDSSTFDQSRRRLTRIEGESAISFARVGLSVVGDLRMESTGKRIHLRGHGNHAIRFDGPAFNERTINDSIITDNSSIAILDRGFGPLRFSMKNCLSFMTLAHIIRVEDPAGPDSGAGVVTVENSTLVGGRETANSSHTFFFAAGAGADFDIKNSILAGKKNQANATNVVSISGSATDQAIVTLTDSAMVTQLPFAFRTNPWSLGSYATVPPAETIFGEDPAFVGVDSPFDPTAPDFLNVRNNAYANKGANGGPLSGGAAYVGGFNSSVNTWELY